MWEDKTLDAIHSEILSNISNTYAKNVGFPTHDITKSFAIQEVALYLALQTMVNKLDVDNLTRGELTKYVSQRKGLTRKIATKAKGIVTVTGSGSISFGDLFSTSNGIRFRSLENKTITTTADIKIEAINTGSSGVVGAGTITQFPVTLPGMVSVTNSQATYDGYEEETDDSLRTRYYEALQIPATSGNRFHYSKWAKEVTGVGDARVISLWNGANTVKVIIIDSNKQPANQDLIDRVQNYMDPKGTDNTTWGAGFGEAPIGAYTTVVSATAKPIDITVDIQEMANYTLTDVTNNIKANLTTYFKEIAFQQDFVSYAKIGSIILSTEGVQDYQTLTVNGGTSNITIADTEVPTLGTVITT